MQTDSIRERCNVCILPRSARLIEFDEQGTCALCQAQKKIEAAAQDPPADQVDLDGVIERIKEQGRGRPFDCIVGVSGGRDSSYLLYLLVREHQLRCLATYYRTPFTSDIIDANVRRLVSRLDVPLVEMDISQEYHRQVARDLSLLWARDPQAIIANLACAPCKLVNREILRIAAKNGVRTIVAGANVFEAVQIAAGQSSTTTIVPGQAAAQHLALPTQFRKMLVVVRRGIELLRTSPGLWRYLPIAFQASILYISPHTPFLRLRYPQIQAVEYFYHADWNEAHCQQALQEIGWELPPGYHSTWKADCTFAELKNYMFYETVGITYMDAFLSNMVRAGVLGREEAIHRLQAEGRVSEARLADACSVLELPDDFCAATP